MSELRKNILDESRRIVVKIGSRILVDSEKGGVRTRYIQKLADSVARLMEAGKEVVIVTSGAVGTGMSQLGYKEKPTVLAEKQACAAVGQIDLMYAYREMFRWVQLSVGQILLSADDFRGAALGGADPFVGRRFSRPHPLQELAEHHQGDACP